MELKNLKDVHAALQTLGLTATTDVLRTLSATCRDAFLGKLTLAIDGDQNSISQLEAMLGCFSADFRSQLAACGHSPAADLFAGVAANSPRRLLSAVAAAQEKSHAGHAAAKSYLDSAFGSVPPPPPPPIPAESTRSDTPPSAQRPAPSTAPPASAESQEQHESPRPFSSCHIYGSTYALCFNATAWNGEPGVMLDAAVSIAPKIYDWNNAVHFWINLNEVAGVLAVLRRFSAEITFAAHGSRNEKSFSIVRQDNGYYAKVTCKGETHHPIRGAKILPGQITQLSMLFLQVLLAGYPGIPAKEVIATVRSAYLAEA
jgi:hypothetical protein